MTEAPTTPATRRTGRDLERAIARLLTAGTYLSIGLMAIGVLLMLIDGISPLEVPPPFDPSTIPADIVALRPVGFLWLGLVVIIATPLVRVAASGIGFAGGGERRMALVAVAILVVIAVGVFLGVAVEH
jgi:uncharacterized membrane protein